MKFSVIIPAYNEERFIKDVIHRVARQPSVGEIIVVDDCSRDGTAAIITETAKDDPRLRLIRHERNQGKGAALRTGIRHANCPLVIIQDADLEYDPADYARILGPFLADSADIVYGSRFLFEGQWKDGRRRNAIANRILTCCSNLASGLRVTDMETCYKAFRREIIQGIHIEENRFGFEPEITAKIARLHCRIHEVPISYAPRSHSEGKKIGWKDGFRALYCIAKYNFGNR